MPTSDRLEAFFADLRGQVQDLRTDEYSRILYSTDASIYQVKPLGVLLPRHVEEVQAAVETAARHKIPVLPRAGGSSLAGQAVNEALVIDMTRHLDGIVAIDAEARTVRVQPGMPFDTLNAALKPHGLRFGPDPASGNRAAMGGIVGNNSTGAHSILYGMTADHVLECRGFLSDGSAFHFAPLDEAGLARARQRSGREGDIYRALHDLTTTHADVIAAGTPRHWRRCGGYNLDRLISSDLAYKVPRDDRFNLAKLICGAEGTLGVMTEVTLGLVPLPTRTALGLVMFDTQMAALEAVPDILEVDPSAIELVDNIALTLCKNVPEYARLLASFMQGEPNCMLITEFYGETEAELRGRIEGLTAHLQRRGIPATVVPAIDERQQANVWSVRKAGLGLLMSMKGDHKPLPFIEDSAVPPENLAEYIHRLETFCGELGTKMATYAHASAGCLHVRPIINAKVAEDIEKLPMIAAFAVELIGEYGGALSSEHGDGRSRSWLNERFFGKPLYDLYRQVKRAFDPDNLLNPGNIVDAGPMTENLRFGPDYRVAEIREHIDFSSDQGFHRAIEMCNGAGVCRKLTAGTMCPSFMATREEEHSTRGRANALRAALSGHLPATELTSERMYRVMDLCISCKGCKAECPSSVDMAKIKMEFQARYHEAHGVPLRAKVFGHIAALSRLASGPLAPLVNWKLGLGVVKALNEKLLGVSRRRTLPTFAREPFTAWHRKHRQAAGIDPRRRQVVLFNDTFNTYNDPHVAIAALELLEAGGYEVLLPGHKCCGRPMMSKGLVEAARAAARDTVKRLAPFAKAGIPIVGLEPSCLLSFRDEYPDLLPDDPDVAVVAEHSFMLEEWLARELETRPEAWRFDGTTRDLLLHGHCHQKALIGTGPLHAVLSAAGYTVAEVDSGCCGMAGSFGYEAEHHDISLKMAERRLLPAVRSAAADTCIGAAGTSCRHQIADGTGRTARHPAELLRAALLTTNGDTTQ